MGNSPIEPTAPSDQALIEAVLRRDETALRALYERYGGLVFTLAVRKLHDRGLAEEVLQDVFLRCWERAAGYRPEAGSLAAWLMGITRHRCIDVGRSKPQQARAREATELPPADCLPSAEQADETDRIALCLCVHAALAELTPAQRQAIVLAFYGDLSQSQIAGRIGTPLGTVKTRVRAGLARLRHSLLSVAQPEGDVSAVAT